MRIRFGLLNTPTPFQQAPFVRKGKSYDVFGRGSHETRLFRDEMIFGLPRLMTTLYPEKTNVLCYASSGGHEPCSLGIGLANELGSLDKADDRFHIHAMDTNPSLIQLGNNGLIILSKIDTDCFPDFDGSKLNDFFTQPEEIRDKSYGDIFYPVFGSENYSSYEMTPALKRFITFKQANLLDDLRNGTPLFKDPVVFMFRNVWFNFRGDDIKPIAESLFQALQPGSLVVLGETETTYYWWDGRKEITVPDTLEKVGFKPFIKRARTISREIRKEGYLFLKE